jgi:hypothetical protein
MLLIVDGGQFVRLDMMKTIFKHRAGPARNVG